MEMNVNADSTQSEKPEERQAELMEELARKVIKEASASMPDRQGGDYYYDGLLYCGKCKTKKQTRIKLAGEQTVVRCICKCEAEERKRIDREHEKEEEMRRIEKLKGASLMEAKLRSCTLSSFTRKEDNQKLFTIVKNYVDNFDTFYENNRGILFWGTVGTGKSFAAACIANELLNQRVPVVMTSFVKILQLIQNGDADETEMLNKINNARLLIIDDLGTERNTDYALEKVYNVVDSRYRVGKPMILTTNLDLQDMQMTQDVRYQRIYDRIFEMCHPVRVAGASWRIAQAKERFSETKRLLEQ